MGYVFMYNREAYFKELTHISMEIDKSTNGGVGP